MTAPVDLDAFERHLAIDGAKFWSVDSLSAAFAELRAARQDAKRLDYMESCCRPESSIRLPNGTFKSVKAWAIAADKGTLREAIDVAIAKGGPT